MRDSEGKAREKVEGGRKREMGKMEGVVVAGNGAGGQDRGQITNHAITSSLHASLYSFFTSSLLLLRG